MTPVFEAYAAYYDLLYRDKDYVGEASYVRSLLARHGVHTGALLELGCGTGKHAEQLARLGYSVHGIDSSEAMVERASERIPQGLEARVRFQAGDVRTARLCAQFEAVVSLFHVASYQSTNQDLAAMFETAQIHLIPGGTFVFDFWYGPAVLTDRPAVRVKHLENETIRVTRIAEPTLRPNENVVDVLYTVLVTEKETQVVAEFRETHRMRYLFLPEVRGLLHAVGMDLVQAEEWGTSAELGCESWQAVVMARKRA
jgi:SAM-dependent methyltransferase